MAPRPASRWLRASVAVAIDCDFCAWVAQSLRLLHSGQAKDSARGYCPLLGGSVIETLTGSCACHGAGCGVSFHSVTGTESLPEW